MGNARGHASVVVVLMLVLALIAAACDGGEAEETTTTAAPETTTTAAPATTTTAPPETTTTTAPPETTTTTEAGPDLAALATAAWEGSAHADLEAEAFAHWNEDDPALVPASCAKCHSDTGFQDFLGADGSGYQMVNADHAIGTTVTCSTCHNDRTANYTSVLMPSGIELDGLGSEAVCMSCHQGRSSTFSVESAIEGLEADAVSEDLGFINIHYFAAAATKYGTAAKGGYEYPGETYDGYFVHVAGYETCADCHDNHSLELKLEECAACHEGVGSAEDLRDVRMAGSLVDFDGDGDLSEGIYYEIVGLQEQLYAAMQAYGSEVAGAAIAYNSHAYPYWFFDTNEDGEAGEDEANYGNQYKAWTPRLLQAAYNYQVSLKDPGGYAHGGKYIIELLYDSLTDVNSALAEPADTAALHRIDHGHFAGSEEAFRHWDEDGGVPGSCAKCHSDAGLPAFLETGEAGEQPTANGFLCTTCHADLSDWSRYEVAEVTFPSGAVVDIGNPDANLCLNCHQGRSSSTSVDEATAGADGDAINPELGFINVHYFAAGATLFGNEAMGAYQYEGKTYNGRFEHVDGFTACTDCHGTHTLEVKADSCGGCHPAAVEGGLAAIRMAPVDYDGDGDVDEGMAGEIATLTDLLYAEIQAYANGIEGAEAIIYDSHAYPYFFIDTNANGASDPGEGIYPNRYATWTGKMLKAAYNFQYAQKDPGAFAHNGKYVVQALYDSIEDLGGDVSGLTRP